MSSKTFASSADVDAIDLLTLDHDELAPLFDRFEALASHGAPAHERRRVAEEICSLLHVHSLVEQEVFYPAARRVLAEKYLVDEAREVHDIARDFVDEILGADPVEARYDARVRILGELIAQHVEEEESVLFPHVRRTALDLQRLGVEMSARRATLRRVPESAHA
jgi:hemerythrin-like domain-containing protein